MTESAKRGLTHTSNFVTLKRQPYITLFISELSGQNFQSYKYNDRTVLLLDFKPVDQTQAESQSLKFKKIECVYNTPFHKFIHIIWNASYIVKLTEIIKISL